MTRRLHFLTLTCLLLFAPIAGSQDNDGQSKISQLLKQLKTSQKRERRQRELAEIRLHALQLRRASDFWDAGKLLTARGILGQTKPELRGFAWGYLHARFHRAQRELLFDNKHSVGGSAVAVSPDGKLIVTSGLTVDQTIRIWDAKTYEPLATLNGHHGFIECVAISHNSKTIASGDIRHQVKLWDAESYQLKNTIDAHEDHVLAVAFSPNDDLLVTGSRDRKVKVWDLQTGAEILEFDEGFGPVVSVAFSPNGKWIATAASNVKLWDATTGELKHTLGTAGGPAVTFSPNGKLLATGQADGKIRAAVFDTDTGGLKTSLPSVSSDANGICFSPDGKTIAVACEDHTVHICDAATGTNIEVLTGHSHAVSDVKYCVEGDRVASTGRFSSRVFDLGSKPRPLTLRSTTPGVFGPNSKLIATSTRRGAEIRDLASGDLLAKYDVQDEITAVAFNPDGRLLATASSDKTIILWDLASGEEYASLDHDGHAAAQIWFSPDDLQMASWHRDSLIVWKIAPRVQKNFDIRSGLEELPKNRAFTFSPNGSLFAIYQDKSIKLLDARTGAVRHTLNESQSPSTLEFSPDGKQVLGGYFYPWGAGDFARVWDAQSGQMIIALNGTSASYGPKPKWSVDGRFFLTRNGKPRGVNVWDASTGQRVSSMYPNALMLDAVFFPDGKRIACTDYDQVVISDTATGEQLFTLSDAGGHYLATSPDGKYLAAIDYHGSTSYSLTIWDATLANEQ